jgi:hypothetical protein
MLLLKEAGVQACEWISDCPIEGCTNKCQVPSHLGNMLLVLEDAAWDLDWWQVCPDLAQRTWQGLRVTEALAPIPAGTGNVAILLWIHALPVHKKQHQCAVHLII